MNKEQARELIRETFQDAFSKEKFKIFLKNSFHSIDLSKTFHLHGQYIKDSFKEFIKSYQRIGQYIDADGKAIDMLIVHLQKETSLVRARTAQRNFVARYLKDRGEKDAGLVAFVSPDDCDWRFSFVKMEYRFEQSDQGTFKAKEHFTPARRYSFLVGKNENSHTAQRQLVSLLSQDVNHPVMTEIEDVFNIEKVSQEFFERYRELYLQIKESLDLNVESDSKIKEDFIRHGVDTVDFAKKLLGQIVFLYFLQKKGWFGVEKGCVWGSGPKNFLRKLFNRDNVGYDNFFNDVLEPLFYEALAIDRGPSAYWDKLKCRIPFLNGGLFEPLNGYSWETTDILLDNKLFSNQEKTKQGDIGTGVLDVFDRFNFTVKEDEPLEKEVAVDPEMLGKVFENLLGVKDRKSKGAFYTPRQIVHYMCQESLINYLATECGDGIDRRQLEDFIRHGEMNIEHEARIIKEGKETKDYPHMIGDSIRSHALEMDTKLVHIKVCDPAVGSGAFLVGMMNEIIRARNTLTNYIENGKTRTLYNFKRQAIQHSLYGVDIDPGAVEIAKLRLWLSLVVDEEDMQEIKPLPNLDYKIMQGNSLLEEFEGIKLFDETLIADALDNHKEIERLQEERKKLGQELLRLNHANKLTRDKRKVIDEQAKKIDKRIKKLTKPVTTNDEPMLFAVRSEAKEKAEELQRLYDAFPAAVSKTRKQELKNRIEMLEWDLIETTLKEQNKENSLARIQQHKQANIKPFFLWKLHFGEVFREKGGFDVVIGNPPYIQLQKDGGHLAKLYEQSNFKTFIRTGDIYLLFYEHSQQLLCSSGVACFITSNKWMRTGYGKQLRKFFCEVITPLILIDFGDTQLFKNATTYTNIMLLRNMKNIDCKCLAYDLSHETNIQGDLSAHLKQIDGKYCSEYTDESFLIVDRCELQIKKIVESKGIPLKEWDVNIYRGILTGYNEAFIVDAKKKEMLCKEDPKSEEILRPILRGRDIKRYKSDWAGFWLINSHNGYSFNSQENVPPIDIKDYPAIKRHLDSYIENLTKRYDKGDTPYNLRNCAYLPELEKGKLIWAEIVFNAAFYYDEDSYFPEATSFVMTGECLKYLQALLNSKLITFVFKRFYSGGDLRGGTFRYKKIFVEKIPIPRIEEIQQKQYEELVDKILADRKKGKDTNCFENEIDELVFDLYGLTEEEKKIVRNEDNKENQAT